MEWLAKWETRGCKKNAWWEQPERRVRSWKVKEVEDEVGRKKRCHRRVAEGKQCSQRKRHEKMSFPSEKKCDTEQQVAKRPNRAKIDDNWEPWVTAFTSLCPGLCKISADASKLATPSAIQATSCYILSIHKMEFLRLVLWQPHAKLCVSRLVVWNLNVAGEEFITFTTFVSGSGGDMQGGQVELFQPFRLVDRSVGRSVHYQVTHSTIRLVLAGAGLATTNSEGPSSHIIWHA